MSQEVNHDRRQYLGTVAMMIAAAPLGIIGSAQVQSGKTKRGVLPTIKAGTDTSFTSIKQIDAGLLNVGYAENGPAKQGTVGRRMRLWSREHEE